MLARNHDIHSPVQGAPFDGIVACCGTELCIARCTQPVRAQPVLLNQQATVAVARAVDRSQFDENREL